MLTFSHISVWKIALILSSITISIDGINTNQAMKSVIENKFEVLLNLYKINPLRQSKIYKQFSNRMLLPNRVDNPTDVLHFDSNESTRERKARTKVNLKQIEEAIHMTQPRHKFKIGPPSYTVHDVVPEKFNGEQVFDISRLHKDKGRKEVTEVFDNILDHISRESNETPRKVQSNVDFLANNGSKSFLDDNRTNLRIGAIINLNKNVTLRNENSNRIGFAEEVVIMR
ncbi:hypothetical protein evm_011489 [Chilo suppressalis]|nr:hypothetical protein evm_011489 [Chilo suppressalis]